MEEPENIIHRVYREIGYPEPHVEQYPSFDDLVNDYTNWKDLARPINVTYWSYNYPILNPYGLWARSYLYEEGFQFDLTKKANKVGCLNDPIYQSKIDIGPEILYERYICAAIDAVLKNQGDEFRNKIGEVTSKTDNTKEEKFFEELQDAYNIEDPTSPLSVSDCIFLGGYSWLKIERDILKAMRRWIGKPVCDEHYQNVNMICDSGVLFVTFRKIVFWIKILT